VYDFPARIVTAIHIFESQPTIFARSVIPCTNLNVRSIVRHHPCRNRNSYIPISSRRNSVDTTNEIGLTAHARPRHRIRRSCGLRLGVDAQVRRGGVGLREVRRQVGGGGLGCRNRSDVLSGLRLLGCRERLRNIYDSMRILRRILLSEIARGLRGLLRVSG